jgi:hypothetical protein
VPDSKPKRRLLVAATYALVAISFLCWFYWGDSFCDESRFHGVLIPVLRLSLVITALYLVSGVIGDLLERLLKDYPELSWSLPLSSAMIVGIGVFSIPTALYRGYGRFSFEGTRADVSCLFREGYAITAEVLLPVIFGGLTLIAELIVSRPWQRR